ncbi:hypothetical protein BDF22DRAFT_774806 [Syncephalis plumigaleata]|nr:hypothetical protein BDF22DRAFT_774806 [Syncephalis plumigaleata]
MGAVNSRILPGRKDGRGRTSKPSLSITRSLSCSDADTLNRSGNKTKTPFFQRDYWRCYHLRKPLAKHWIAARASDDDVNEASPASIPGANVTEDWASSNVSPSRSIVSSDDSSSSLEDESDTNISGLHSKERRSMQFTSGDELFRSRREPIKRRSSMSTLEKRRSSGDHLSIIREGPVSTMNDPPLEPNDLALSIPRSILPAQPISIPRLAAASLFGGPPVVTPNIEWQQAHLPTDVVIPALPESPGPETAYVSNLLLHCMLGGEYMAPLRNPRNILDKMAATFPKCKIIGCGTTTYYIGAACTLPLNCQIVFQQSLNEISLASNSVDYIHQQMKAFLFSTAGWVKHLSNLRSVLKPGKYLELVELAMLPSRVGPGSSRLVCMIRRLMLSRGIDPEMPRKLEPLLKQSGFSHVERLDVNVPIGEWGGPCGRYMLWLVDVIILMVRRAVVDGVVWDLYDNLERDPEQDPRLAITTVNSDLLSHICCDDYQNITANEFDALWDTTRREMAVNNSYSTIHVYLAK